MKKKVIGWSLFLSTMVVIGFLIGCQSGAEQERINDNLKQNFVGDQIGYSTYQVYEISYIMDKRTNLCYAYFWGGNYHGGPGFSNVECTEKVLELIRGYHQECETKLCPDRSTAKKLENKCFCATEIK